MSALCEADTRHLSAQTDRWSFSGPVRAAASWIALAVAKAMFSTSHQGGLNRLMNCYLPWPCRQSKGKDFSNIFFEAI